MAPRTAITISSTYVGRCFGTIRLRLIIGSFACLYAWITACEYGIIHANAPIFWCEYSSYAVDKEVFTPEEIRRLLDAQEEPLRTLLLMAILTGMRQGERFG